MEKLQFIIITIISHEITIYIIIKSVDYFFILDFQVREIKKTINPLGVLLNNLILELIQQHSLFKIIGIVPKKISNSWKTLMQNNIVVFLLPLYEATNTK